MATIIEMLRNGFPVTLFSLRLLSVLSKVLKSEPILPVLQDQCTLHLDFACPVCIFCDASFCRTMALIFVLFGKKE